MRMHMREFGSTLCTRHSGRLAYAAVLDAFDKGDRVEFDFEGVDSVTNSFADELFGRLARELGMDRLREVTSFANINPSSARFIRSVMDRRTAVAG